MRDMYWWLQLVKKFRKCGPEGHIYRAKLTLNVWVPRKKIALAVDMPHIKAGAQYLGESWILWKNEACEVAQHLFSQTVKDATGKAATCENEAITVDRERRKKTRVRYKKMVDVSISKERSRNPKLGVEYNYKHQGLFPMRGFRQTRHDFCKHWKCIHFLTEKFGLRCWSDTCKYYISRG